MNTSYPSDLTDREWASLQRHLPERLLRRRWPRHSLRTIFDAIFYLLRTGCPWRYLPRDFPPWQTVYYHFRRLRLGGIWHLVLTDLRRAERERVERDPQPSAAIMDAQSVKSVEESASISGYDGHKRMGGRPKKLGTPAKVAMARALDADHSHSIGEICQSVGVSRATLYRYLGHPDRQESTAVTRPTRNDDK